MGAAITVIASAAVVVFDAATLIVLDKSEKRVKNVLFFFQ